MSQIVCFALPDAENDLAQTLTQLEFGEVDGRVENLSDRNVFVQRAANPDHILVFIVPDLFDFLVRSARSAAGPGRGCVQTWEECVGFVSGLRNLHPDRVFLMLEWEFLAAVDEIPALRTRLLRRSAGELGKEALGGIKRPDRSLAVIEWGVVGADADLKREAEDVRASAMVFFDRLFKDPSLSDSELVTKLREMASALLEVELMRGRLAELAELKANQRVMERRAAAAEKTLERLQSRLTSAESSRDQFKNALSEQMEVAKEAEALKARVVSVEAEVESSANKAQGLKAERNKLATKLKEARGEISRLTTKINVRDRKIAQLDDSCTSLADAIEDMRKSRSWKMTAPVRQLVEAVRGNPGKPEEQTGD